MLGDQPRFALVHRSRESPSTARVRAAKPAGAPKKARSRAAKPLRRSKPARAAKPKKSARAAKRK
jgi:hypothetical protein